MKAEKTATIQVSQCLASELDSVIEALVEAGGERPVIDDGFILTDLANVRYIIEHGEPSPAAREAFEEALALAKNHPEICYDEKVMFTL